MKTQPLASIDQRVLLIVFLYCLTLFALPSLGNKNIDHWGPLGYHTMAPYCGLFVLRQHKNVFSIALQIRNVGVSRSVFHWGYIFMAVDGSLPSIGATVWWWPHVHTVSSSTYCIRISLKQHFILLISKYSWPWRTRVCGFSPYLGGLHWASMWIWDPLTIKSTFSRRTPALLSDFCSSFLNFSLNFCLVFVILCWQGLIHFLSKYSSYFLCSYLRITYNTPNYAINTNLELLIYKILLFCSLQFKSWEQSIDFTNCTFIY